MPIDLFNGAPPQSVTGSVVTQNGMPDWYQEYIRGIAGQGTQVAAQPYQQYPGQRVAGFTGDQNAAFQGVRNMQGSWQPGMQGALSAANQILPAATNFLNAGAQYGAQSAGIAGQAAGQANSAVAGGPATWNTHQANAYMSPYTSQVVNEIARLGNQNLHENVLPGINDSFIGSGGFGSQRNADMIGRGIRDAQTNISGLQNQALQSGYFGSANIFASDANRIQQQQNMQANTALQGGNLAANAALSAGQLANAGAQIGSAAADQAAQRQGALAQLGQQMGYQDATALGAIGSAQQQLNQFGMDTGYQNFLEQRDWDRNNLSYLNSLVRGMQLPTSTTQMSNQPYGNGGTSPLQWLNAMYGIANTQRPATTTGG